MRFSIIMPSLLADYPGSATGRDKKLIRAIQSVLDQSFTDFELIVISDGCKLTEYIVKRKYTEIEVLAASTSINTCNLKFIDERLKLLSVPRKQLFSNVPRNTGIENAKGEYIIYLDADDYFGKDHLKKIDAELSGFDWVYFNDRVWNGTEWIERSTDCTQYGRCGTSNICHKASLNLRWIEAGYGHDYYFIQQLLKFPNHKQISTGEYHVCHYSNGYCV